MAFIGKTSTYTILIGTCFIGAYRGLQRILAFLVKLAVVIHRKAI